MTANPLLELGSVLLPIPGFVWKHQVSQSAAHTRQARRVWMSADHHRVHHFVVSELAVRACPLAPELIAGALELPLENVGSILADLEKHMTFLFRNPRGEVVWAYPVTVEETPHALTFRSGEKLYAA